MGGTTASSTVLLPATDEAPDWWPFASRFPHWQVWRGVAGLLYARRPRTSPPKVVRAATPGQLAEAVAACEAARR